MYKALYRTERPETFDEVIGQEHVVRVLKNQIANDTLGHAYLFCGTRGTGKTTMARLLAKAVNCTSSGERPCGYCDNCQSIKDGSFIDMIEIDAASNNGVESVREIRDSVNYPASMGNRKVYIIDEVHMLSTAAFNALLKTLEEPPTGIMFVLATTDPQKLPQTILSRCMRFNFRRVPERQIAKQMAGICDKRGISITEDALNLLASNADGSVRDGLSLLDQCLAGSSDVLNRSMVLDFLGAVSENFFLELTEKVHIRDIAGALILLEEVLQEGKDVKQLLNDWMAHYRSLLLTKYIRDPENILNLSKENIEKLKMQSRSMELSTINKAIITLAKTINDARYSTQPRTLMELAIVVLATGLYEDGMPAKQTKPINEPIKRSSARIKNDNAVQDNEKIVTLKEETKASESEVPPWETENEDCATEVPLHKSNNSTTDFGRSQEDLEELWDRVWDRLPGNGSISMVRMNTTLAAINDKEFKVIIGNDVVREIAEKNAGIISKAMEDETGKSLKMVLRSADGNESEDEASQTQSDTENKQIENVKKVADELENFFNIKPRIE
ncbi:MAG: DNA polymerase III subunit gamma/tau [Eubacterium sp.]|nr:DNA polymerase III subunit gamma/tau [Eubacterium sp.]